MPSCPRCQFVLAVDAIQCPQCHLTLKAFGHPGIPLHRSAGEDFLCATCRYHADDTCTFPQRPEADTCTLYTELNQPVDELSGYQRPSQPHWQGWVRRHRGPLLLAGLFGICLLLAMLRAS